MIKPYQKVSIVESGEPLIPIPLDYLWVVQPHPYLALGADYGSASPYYLRSGVVDSLIKAQEYLRADHPSWRLVIFDAYRPVSVQQFMVDHTFMNCLQTSGLTREELSQQQEKAIYEQVHQIWAYPSLDPLTPPPHSTGGAVDLTLAWINHQLVPMGGEIDELSPRTVPDYYRDSVNVEEQQFHQARKILYQMMKKAGFQRHPGEWWHFSLGDQLWAYLEGKTAYYGRVESSINPPDH